MSNMTDNYTEISVQVVVDENKIFKEKYCPDGFTINVKDRIKLMDEYIECVSFSKETKQQLEQFDRYKNGKKPKCIEEDNKNRCKEKCSLHQERKTDSVLSVNKKSALKQKSTSKSFEEVLNQIGEKERRSEKRKTQKESRAVLSASKKHKIKTKHNFCVEGKALPFSRRKEAGESSTGNIRTPSKLVSAIESSKGKSVNQNTYLRYSNSDEKNNVLEIVDETQAISNDSYELSDNLIKGNLEQPENDNKLVKSGTFDESSYNILLNTLSECSDMKPSDLRKETIQCRSPYKALRSCQNEPTQQIKQHQMKEKTTETRTLYRGDERGDSVETTSDYDGSSSGFFSDDDLEFDDVREKNRNLNYATLKYRKQSQNISSGESSTGEVTKLRTNKTGSKERETNLNNTKMRLTKAKTKSNIGESKTDIVDIMTSILNQIESHTSTEVNKNNDTDNVHEPRSGTACKNNTICGNLEAYKYCREKISDSKRQAIQKHEVELLNSVRQKSDDTESYDAVHHTNKFGTETRKNFETQNQALKAREDIHHYSQHIKITNCSHGNIKGTNMDLSEISDNELEPALEPDEIETTVQIKNRNADRYKKYAASPKQNNGEVKFSTSPQFGRYRSLISQSRRNQRNHQQSNSMMKPQVRTRETMYDYQDCMKNDMVQKERYHWQGQAWTDERIRPPWWIHYSLAHNLPVPTQNNHRLEFKTQHRKNIKHHRNGHKYRSRSRSPPRERSDRSVSHAVTVKQERFLDESPRKGRDERYNFDRSRSHDKEYGLSKHHEHLGYKSTNLCKDGKRDTSVNEPLKIETLVQSGTGERNGSNISSTSDDKLETNMKLDEKGSLQDELANNLVLAYEKVTRKRTKKRKHYNSDTANSFELQNDWQLLEQTQSNYIDRIPPTCLDTTIQTSMDTVISGSFEKNGIMKFETDNHIKCFELIRDSAFKQTVRYSDENFNKYAKRKFVFEDELIQQLQRNFERYLSTDNERREKRPMPRFVTAEIMTDAIIGTWREPHVVFPHSRQLREFDDVIGYVGFNIPCYWCELVFDEGKFLRAFPVLDPIGHRNDTMYCQTEHQTTETDV